MRLFLRPARVSDLPAILQLDSLVFDELPFPYFVLRQYLDTFGPFMTVAENEGRLAGYITGGPDFSGKSAWIHTIAVHPDFQRRGIGKQLLSAFFEHGLTYGIDTFRLTVHPDSSAVSLYRTFGFLDEKREENYYADAQTRMVMVKKVR
jgi:ribosomal protein S18 acetylase RimI-like enzyme